MSAEEMFASAFKALDALDHEISRLEEELAPQFNEILRNLRASFLSVEWDLSHLCWEYED